MLVLLPTTLFAVGQLGLTSSMTFFAGRDGRLVDLERHSVVLGLLVSAAVAAIVLVALPALEGNVLRTAPDALLRVSLIALPLRLVATLAGSVLYGRHRFRAYNLILVAQSVLWLVLVVVVVGVLDLGVDGALAAYLAFLAIGTIAVLVELHRARRAEEARGSGGTEPVPARALLGYGLRLYPASVGTFFGYRADVFLLGWLLGSASEIGVYAVAVSLAELVFNVPDSVGTVFFPRVASATREEADSIAPAMTRMTILVTAAAAVALIPVAAVALHLLLPAFTSGIVPLVVIMPGIVSLSVAKVLTSYLSGIERLGAVTVASVVSLAVNVAANLVLIPAWGIVGAAAASLVSYSVYAVLMVGLSARVSGAQWSAFAIPRREDLQRLAGAAGRLTAALRPTGRG